MKKLYIELWLKSNKVDYKTIESIAELLKLKIGIVKDWKIETIELRRTDDYDDKELKELHNQ